jgi:hypothetical protein
MRTTSSWDFSIGQTLIVSWRIYGKDWPCLDWNCTQIRRAGSEFGRFAEANRRRRGEGKPETFDFLDLIEDRGHGVLDEFVFQGRHGQR